jgi:DNA-binding MarR family transcriptional regulator
MLSNSIPGEQQGARLTTRKQARAAKAPPRGKLTVAEADFPFDESVGYQIRMTHRALHRFLQVRIEPYGVTLGMWYFLRALWNEDGLSQRELSDRVGTMEPTTLSAILNMEKKGLVRRVQNKTDRRKWHVCLTPRGRALKAELIPLARDVVNVAVQSLSQKQVKQLLEGLAEIQKNLHATALQLESSKVLE